MGVEPFADKSVAAWLFAQRREWFELITTGPIGYDAYARLRFIPDPVADDDDHLADDDGPDPPELWQLAVAVSHLAHHTTSDQIFFLIWDGWGTSYGDVGAARIDLEDPQFGVVRSYYLFRGDCDLFSWTPPPTDDRSAPRAILPDPAFIWPADHAWCIADDIDPHFATVAATHTAITSLQSDRRVDVSDVEDPTIGPPRHY